MVVAAHAAALAAHVLNLAIAKEAMYAAGAAYRAAARRVAVLEADRLPGIRQVGLERELEMAVAEMEAADAESEASFNTMGATIRARP